MVLALTPTLPKFSNQVMCVIRRSTIETVQPDGSGAANISWIHRWDCRQDAIQKQAYGKRQNRFPRCRQCLLCTY